MQLQFEAAMSNGLGDAFTRKYIGSLNLTLGHTKCCPVPSTSCHLFRCNVKFATSNGLEGNTFSKNVMDGLFAIVPNPFRTFRGFSPQNVKFKHT